VLDGWTATVVEFADAGPSPRRREAWRFFSSSRSSADGDLESERVAAHGLFPEPVTILGFLDGSGAAGLGQPSVARGGDRTASSAAGRTFKRRLTPGRECFLLATWIVTRRRRDAKPVEALVRQRADDDGGPETMH